MLKSIHQVKRWVVAVIGFSVLAIGMAIVKKVIEGDHVKMHMLWKPGEKKEVGRRKTQELLVEEDFKIYEQKRESCIELSC